MISWSNSTFREARVDDYKLNTHPQICPHTVHYSRHSDQAPTLWTSYLNNSPSLSNNPITDIKTEFALWSWSLLCLRSNIWRGSDICIALSYLFCVYMHDTLIHVQCVNGRIKKRMESYITGLGWYLKSWAGLMFGLEQCLCWYY